MLKNVLSGLFGLVPAPIRRWSIRISNARFTVTAGAVIFNEEGKVLLLKHRFRAGSGWGMPGGFLQAGEQPLEALQRELKEEIGIQIDDAEIFWSRTFRRPEQIEILFRGRFKGTVKPQSMEVELAEWFAVDSLPQGLSQDQKFLIERAVEKR